MNSKYQIKIGNVKFIKKDKETIKDTTFNIRLSKTLKKDFDKWCSVKGITATDALTQIMVELIKQ